MLAMWLATVLVLSESSRPMSWLLLPLASVKISSSRSVRAARIALAASWLLAVIGMSRSRMRSRSFPAIWGRARIRRPRLL